MFIPTPFPLPVYRPPETCPSLPIQYCDSPALSSLWGAVLKAESLGSEPGRVCADLCVLCVLIFVRFYLFCINITFLFEKQIQLWIDFKKKSHQSLFFFF